jgi:hypothetical protein
MHKIAIREIRVKMELCLICFQGITHSYNVQNALFEENYSDRLRKSLRIDFTTIQVNTINAAR